MTQLLDQYDKEGKLVTQLLDQYDKEGKLVTQLLDQYDKEGKLVTQLLDQYDKEGKLVTQLLDQYDKEGKLMTLLLDQYDKEGKLTLHNDTIPQDEIWINVGGDHGGGSFKLRLQIANIANPNLKHNTCLLLIANLEDIPENTCKLLSLFNEQFTTL